MNSTVLEIKANSARQTALTEPEVLRSTLDAPATLPAHILAVGEQHRLAGSTWWIGNARPAYEEVAHLSGVVIYNRTTSIFLTQEEAAEAQRLLPMLLQQGPDSQNS